MKLVMSASDVKIISSNNRLVMAKGGKRFVPNWNYQKFQKELLNNTIKEHFEPPYSIVIKVDCYGDIDNVIKPVLDAMQTAKVIDNDKNVMMLGVIKNQIKRNESGKNGHQK